VSTRKKAAVSDTSDTPASPAPTTTRTTRRSLGATPAQVLTPTRRSRRLSNSSVESISNDNPVVTTTRSRRSIRGKATSDNEAEEVELLTIKKRKVADQAGALGSITEEANNRNVDAVEEAEDSNKPSNEASPMVVDLDKEVQLEEPAKPAEQKNGNTETEVVDLFSEEETTSVPVNDAATKAVVGDNSTVSTVSEDTEMEPIKETVNEEKKETASEDADETVSEETKATIPKETEKDTTTVVVPALTEETDKSQATEVKPASDNAEGVKSEKVQAILNRINEFNSLSKKVKKSLPDDQKLKKKKKKPLKKSNPSKKKAVTQTVSTQENPVKAPLPCGADIMKNIPRGKSVSGREWKQPKSNPRYLYKDKGLKMPLEKHRQLKAERMQVRELENRMKEEERARRVDLAARRELNKKRTEENARKSEIVQVIRNTNKIKRMNKKQLRLIQKRDTTE